MLAGLGALVLELQHELFCCLEELVVHLVHLVHREEVEVVVHSLLWLYWVQLAEALCFDRLVDLCIHRLG